MATLRVLAGAMATGLTAALPAAPASALDCIQDFAVYEEAQASARLTFDGKAEPTEDILHHFKIAFPEHKVVFDGIVVPEEKPFWRPHAIVTFGCPKGAKDLEDLAACTVWEGIAYGIDETGNISYLQPSGYDNPAATTLLLPDFGASVRLSAAWGGKGLSTAPKDDFRLAACGN